ncbi:MAG: hypothetical protein IT328_27760 [Caldilineaceae bacterium]|nr:hypothetical protein [Caldilineaceae bacterium]
MSHSSHYHSYLLRMWRDDADQPWRASLQDTATNEKQIFADPLTLFVFLIEQLRLDEETDELARLAAWLKVHITDD